MEGCCKLLRVIIACGTGFFAEHLAIDQALYGFAARSQLSLHREIIAPAVGFDESSNRQVAESDQHPAAPKIPRQVHRASGPHVFA
jgi:hypothetical protein